MTITPKTTFFQHAVMFLDGADGAFQQQWDIETGGKKTGVSMSVARHSSKEPVSRVFHVAHTGNEFSSFRQALVDAGHDIADGVQLPFDH